MTSLAAHRRHSRTDEPRPLRTSSLLCLIALVCRFDPRRALEEFHGYRPVFRLRGGRSLLLVELVDALREEYAARRIAGNDPTVLDRAYDLTIDKFSNLSGTPRQGSPVKQNGPDCRLYFGAALHHAEAWRRSHPSADVLHEETAIARHLQRLVVRHFYLSCLDAKRRGDRTRTRYAWSVGDGVIYVWLPSRPARHGSPRPYRLYGAQSGRAYPWPTASSVNCVVPTTTPTVSPVACNSAIYRLPPPGR